MFAYRMVMTKIISISDEAYKELAKQKGKNDSFTKVVLRLTRDTPHRSIEAFAGIWKDDHKLQKIYDEILKERHEHKGRD